ncbi:hypothetical protein BC826DRAFT_976687 [Russula brevipes]|nr:hypothetical protein BC826DRAFT_976687 [Russula brevipes]
MSKGESWGRGSGQDTGMERERTCARWHSERRKQECTAAQHKGKKAHGGTAHEREHRQKLLIGCWYLGEGKERQKEGDSKILRAEQLIRVWGDGICLQGQWCCVKTVRQQIQQGRPLGSFRKGWQALFLQCFQEPPPQGWQGNKVKNRGVLEFGACKCSRIGHQWSVQMGWQALLLQHNWESLPQGKGKSEE